MTGGFLCRGCGATWLALEPKVAERDPPVDQIQLDVREQDLETLALTGKEARDVSGLAIAKVRVVVSPHRR